MSDSPQGVHFVKSHAHEEDVPGTVNLQTYEGDDKAQWGQALFPVPSHDPNDPLLWPTWRKDVILVLLAVYSFIGCCSLLGCGVYIVPWAEEFGVTPDKASELISYPNLIYGFGSFVWIPLYMKFGRRPIVIVTLAIYFAGTVGCSQAKTWETMMVARIFQSFGSGICEALPVQFVNDVYYLHERGRKIGYYTIALCLGSSGPLYAGYMLAAGYGSQLFFYVFIGLGAATFILSIIFVHESRFMRPEVPVDVQMEQFEEKEVATDQTIDTPLSRKKTWLQLMAFWDGVNDKSINPFWTCLRSFTYILVPQVFWVICTYGVFIGICGLAIAFSFPVLITQPPYNWSPSSAGLIAVPGIIAYVLSFPLSWLTDWIAARSTRKNNGIREAEMRLPVMFPGSIIAPAGMILFGMAAQNQLHWMAMMMGYFMLQWSAFWYFTVTLTYAVDSYNSNTAEMLIIINLGKQAISFGMAFKILTWILGAGYAVVLAGAFTAVLIFITWSVYPFYFFGKRVRKAMTKWKLAKWHKQNATGDVH